MDYVNYTFEVLKVLTVTALTPRLSIIRLRETIYPIISESTKKTQNV